MARAFRLLGKGILILVCMAYPWLARSALLGQSGQILQFAAFFLSLVPVFAVVGWMLFHSRNKIVTLAVFFVLGLAIYFMYGHGQLDAKAAFGIPHFVINFFLLCFFGRTLLPGKEPLITRCARYIHGTLQPREEAYTRRVTIAWCVYFAAQILVSILLFEWASLSTWSLFINFLTFPLLVLMFVGEYIVRKITQPHHPHVSILKSIQAFKISATQDSKRL